MSDEEPSWAQVKALMSRWLSENSEHYGSGPVIPNGTVLQFWEDRVRERPELVRVLWEAHQNPSPERRRATW